jgi:hypothetical protein
MPQGDGALGGIFVGVGTEVKSFASAEWVGTGVVAGTGIGERPLQAASAAANRSKDKTGMIFFI